MCAREIFTITDLARPTPMTVICLSSEGRWSQKWGSALDSRQFLQLEPVMDLVSAVQWGETFYIVTFQL